MKAVIRHTGRWLYFQNPEKVLMTGRIGEVMPLLHEAEQSGLYAAGFVSYEAAPAFDSALKTCPADGFPLLCLGLFRAPDVLEDIEEAPTSSFTVGELTPSVSKEEFSSAICAIKERIAEGATYQVNYSYRLNAVFSGDAWAFFVDMVRAQQTEHAAFIETDDYAVCSASPELFFRFSEGKIVARLMKGTARRGRTYEEDQRQAEELQSSPKNRAENIMIVDMIRNDIGRIAEPGSVETVSTYDIEKYPTVWQMTSTVQGDLKKLAQSHEATEISDSHLRDSVALCDRIKISPVRVAEIFKALFPCASITGAPKAKTMEIISGLETSPRKVYTGAIGFMTPQGEAGFSVAIRTALIDRTTGNMEYGVGAGIVWDSDAESEYEETLIKARILTKPRPEFRLLETMLWEPEGGLFLHEEHMRRLAQSASYFDIPLDQEAVHTILNGVGHTCAGVPQRIRLQVAQDGIPTIETAPLHSCGCAASKVNPERSNLCVPAESRSNDPAPLRAALAKQPVDSQDIFLFHKTTHRAVYDKAKADFPDADDVILWNERGEVTESTVCNIVIRRSGRWVTPPVECGLLAGTFREHLLSAGEIEESVLSVDELKAAEELFLINSVRGWRRVSLM